MRTASDPTKKRKSKRSTRYAYIVLLMVAGAIAYLHVLVAKGQQLSEHENEQQVHRQTSDSALQTRASSSSSPLSSSLQSSSSIMIPTSTSTLSEASFDFALHTKGGVIHFNFRRRADGAPDVVAPHAVHFIRSLQRKTHPNRAPSPSSASSSSTSNGPFTPCEHCRFYRAEPVPDFWGSDLLPDSSFGGRWGPPYALLQGTFGGFEATNLSAAAADTNAEARPVLKRGDVAWAGGGGGNHFFVALAAHPEWQRAHTVFASVPEGPHGMEVVDALMRSPKTANRPRQADRPQVTNFDEPVPFALL